MAVDTSAVSYFAPLLAFLIVFVIVFAVLLKTKLLGEHKWGLLFLSFVVATIFVSSAGVTDLVLTMTPWVAALIISLFFILLVVGFVGGKADFMSKGIGIVAVIVAVIIFLASGYVVFSDVFVASPAADFVLSSRFIGALILIVIAGIASWILVKAK